MPGELDTNLRRDPRPTFGRKRELAQIETAFDSRRVVTLVGPPGAGKSHLAHRWASERIGERSGGVWWCDLSAGAIDPADTMAAALGVHLDAEDPSAMLHGRGDTLVVLDNAESALAPCGSLVRALVERSASLELLITSREPLGVSAEHLVHIGPLPSNDAVELFLDRAAATGWAPEAPDRLLLDRLVNRLDGLPLAIELAAARLATLSLPELAKQLDRTLDVLGNERPATRELSLRAALQSSWDLLSEPERQALVDCTVFVDGFSLAAFERLSGQSHQLLEKLLRRSLVLADASEPRRFRMLESLRELALEQRAPKRDTGERHARYYHERAVALADKSSGPDAIATLDAFELDAANIIAAARWLTDKEPQTAAHTLAALYPLVEARGAPAGYLDALRTAVARSGEATLALVDTLRLEGRLAEAETLAASLDPSKDPLRYRMSRSELARQHGKNAEATALLEEALALAEEKLSGVIRSRLGYIAWEAGDIDSAEAHFSAALEQARKSGDERALGRELVYRGLVHLARGESGHAQRDFGRGRQIARRARDRRFEGRACLALGAALVDGGALADAEAPLREAIALFRLVGDLWGLSVGLGYLGVVQARRGEEQAEAALLESIALAERIGDRQLIFGSCVDEGFVDLMQARRATSTEAAVEALGRAKRRLRLADTAPDHSATLLSKRLLAREIELCEQEVGEAPKTPRAERVSRLLKLGPGCAWFETPDGERADIGRRRSLRRILAALADHHPNEASRELLIVAGWPEEKMTYASALRRLQVAIWTLRKLGLRDLIETEEDGYRLLDDLIVAREV